jgi:hypothetical protein
MNHLNSIVLTSKYHYNIAATFHRQNKTNEYTNLSFASRDRLIRAYKEYNGRLELDNGLQIFITNKK